jgi:eukaryotic-like serine/threonine-protein kinase
VTWGGVAVIRGLQPEDPRLIGPYRLVGQLGSGGMGRVFLGLSAGGRPVAVKVIRPELAADPDFRMRFGREVAAARRVSGLFTALVVDADVDGPVAWLATAYVAGPSLSEAVADHGPLPARSLLALAAGLAESLSAIHAAGVVHRDLKPSNVLLAEDGPRVIDFGIARAFEATSLTQAGLVVGSPGFMSPEQAEGDEVGPPSDIFNLGAVLAFAATGQGPFGTGTTAALLYRVVHGSPSLDQMPAEVRPLVEQCLAKDPSQRPTANNLLTEVGALQPTADWLPESLIRAFAQDSSVGPAIAASGVGLGLGAAVAGAHSAARAPTGDNRLQAARAADPLTVTSGNAPHDAGILQGQPEPAGTNRRRRRLWRPAVLALIIGAVLGASAAAGFALTGSTGHSPTAPVQSVPAALTSSPTASASARPTGRGGSASATVSPNVPSSSAPLAPSTAASTYASPSTPPSTYASPSAPPSTYASPSTPPSTYASPSTPPSTYASPSTPPSTYTSPSAPPSTSLSPSAARFTTTSPSLSGNTSPSPAP